MKEVAGKPQRFRNFVVESRSNVGLRMAAGRVSLRRPSALIHHLHPDVWPGSLWLKRSRMSQ